MRHFAFILALLLCGCASFKTRQIDERTETDGTKTTISTYAASRTFFSARSDLAKFKASQTEKQQSAEVGSLNQQGGTNAVQTLRAIADILQSIR